MNPISDINSYSEISRYLGPAYSWFLKLKLRGVGSSKTIYINGIPHFNQIHTSSLDSSYCNFELFPSGLLIRLSRGNQRAGIAFKRKSIKLIEFKSRQIKIATRFGFKIVHDAQIEFELTDGTHFKFYTPVTFYKSMKLFFSKDWMQLKSSFTVDPTPPIMDHGGVLMKNLTKPFI